MRIAQVSPLFESVPPQLYGGTERIVSYLTEELVKLGHDVTLFSAGGSVTRARHVACSERPLRLDPRLCDPVSLHLLMIEEVFRRADEFDLIHFHIDLLHIPIARRQGTAKCVTTLHGRQDMVGLRSFYREFSDMPLVSISNAQREPIPEANWIATVPHGLPSDLYRMGAGKGGYLAFVGRVAPEKGLERAIEIARRSTMPLKIAAKVDRESRDYFDVRIRPLIDGKFIEYLGELNDADKGRLLQDAVALVFPIDWPEPFGLCMIEAMACGTPVIAFGRGSVPEVIEEGVSGYIVYSVGEAVQRVTVLDRIDRRACRDAFERRFTAERMTQDYCAVYRGLTALEPGFSVEYAARRPFTGVRSVQ